MRESLCHEERPKHLEPKNKTTPQTEGKVPNLNDEFQFRSATSKLSREGKRPHANIVKLNTNFLHAVRIHWHKFTREDRTLGCSIYRIMEVSHGWIGHLNSSWRTSSRARTTHTHTFFRIELLTEKRCKMCSCFLARTSKRYRCAW